MADSPEKIGARDLGFRAVRRIPWRHIRGVPEKLRDRNAPSCLRRPATLSQHPRRVRIFKAIDGVTKANVVFPFEIRKLVIVIACAGSVGKNFVKVSICVVVKDGVTECWIAITGST